MGWLRRCAAIIKENKMSLFNHSLLREITHIGDFRSYIVKRIVTTTITATLRAYYVPSTPKALCDESYNNPAR